ncbi:uncharacterized protein BXZ73DRAFT_76735 [Epithele typhae]|uniref:uncharacterized protein n=1 Tax=Epithele typhae TaxID=378194 RepID=UPI0020087FFA|nr:uncharacterized protein BXZ73DRAFT_76735 [Epithele typhae]KAH9935920.1 hypothetical protein BXZ73DRAFT_76735 [Epithele typhae]
MYHGAHIHRCYRASSRFLWFFFGAGTATWWHYHKDGHRHYNEWLAARQCGRDLIPQQAYPLPGAPGTQTEAAANPNQPTTPGTIDKRDRWGWNWSWSTGPHGPSGSGSAEWHRGHPWGRPEWSQQQQQQQQQGQDSWNGERHWGRWGRAPPPAATPVRPEGAWGPPSPMPTAPDAEKDVVQQATDTITDFSETTLNNLLVTVESLKSKLAEHRAQREQQEREIQALREAKFKQFEEWQRQQEAKKDDPPRRLV